MHSTIGCSRWSPSVKTSFALPQRSSANRIGASSRQGSTPFLKIDGLKAEIATTGETILNGVNLIIHHGEVRSIFAKNFSKWVVLRSMH